MIWKSWEGDPSKLKETRDIANHSLWSSRGCFWKKIFTRKFCGEALLWEIEHIIRWHWKLIVNLVGVIILWLWGENLYFLEIHTEKVRGGILMSEITFLYLNIKNENMAKMAKSYNCWIWAVDMWVFAVLFLFSVLYLKIFVNKY